MPPDEEKETARIEAFSDNVFAIAMTLLVLDMKIPSELAEESRPALAVLLVRQWPTYLAFANSFATIGILWLNHHRVFTHIRRTNHVLLLLNTLLLMGVAVLPFPTALLAAYIRESGSGTAALVYSSTLLVISICFNLLWRYASSGHRLLRRAADPEGIAEIRKQYAFGPPLYLLACLAAVVSVPTCLFMHLALAVFFALPPQHRSRRRRAEAGAS